MGTPGVVQKGQRWLVQLADLAILGAGSAAVLLFLGIDKERAEAVYGNIDTLNLRTARKAQDEGGAAAAHLVIDLTPDVASGNYHAVLEEVEGLSRSLLVPYLQFLINKFVQFNIRDPAGNDIHVDSHITTNVILDAPISKQLDHARLLAVDLVRKPASQTIDKSNEYFEKTRLVAFRPTEPARGSKARRIITAILDREDTKSYPEVRIRVEEDEGRQRTVGVNRAKQDALSSAFQLRTFIQDIQPAMPEASNKIVQRLATKMLAVLKKT